MAQVNQLQLLLIFTYCEDQGEKFLEYFQLFAVCIGNSMICSDIWRKYHEW